MHSVNLPAAAIAQPRIVPLPGLLARVAEPATLDVPADFRPAPGSEDRLALPTREGIHLVACSEIRYCAAESNYCHVVLAGGRRIFLAKTIKALVAALPASDFIRPHRSYLIHWRSVRTVHPDRLVLDQGEEIPVARGKYASIVGSLRCRVPFI